jgi:hypothetical protein
MKRLKITDAAVAEQGYRDLVAISDKGLCFARRHAQYPASVKFKSPSAT